MNTSPDTNPTIEHVPVATVVGYANNARVHTGAQVAQIVASVREFGWTSPVLIDEDSVLIAGHGRLEAAREMGLVSVPAIRLRGLSEARKRALRLADNQIPLNAGWDIELLAAEVRASIEEGGPVDVLGFSSAYIAALVAGNERALAEAQQHQRLALMPQSEERDAEGGGTGGDPGDGHYQSQHGVIVICAGEDEQQRVYEQLKAEGFNCRVVVT